MFVYAHRTEGVTGPEEKEGADGVGDRIGVRGRNGDDNGVGGRNGDVNNDGTRTKWERKQERERG